jgi:four helix bundle protein
MRDFRKLRIWERAHQLVLDVYKSTQGFPRRENYGLTSQIRRSAASIPANIAEGCGRSGDAELARFLRIAMGSANELEYHLLLAHDLGYLTQERHQVLDSEVNQLKRMMVVFTKRLASIATSR